MAVGCFLGVAHDSFLQIQESGTLVFIKNVLIYIVMEELIVPHQFVIIIEVVARHIAL